MPKFKVTLEHRQTLSDSRTYKVEAETAEDAEQLIEDAWEAYNDGTTEGMVLPDGSSHNAPDPCEIVDGESSVYATLIEED